MSINLSLGPQSESYKAAMWGRYFEQNLRGNLYVYSIASQALLLAATTGGHPTVINPLGTGVLFVPVRLTLGFTSGTTVIGSVLLAETLNANAPPGATGSAILTGTLVDQKNAQRPLGKGKTLWSPTTNTFTAAPTVLGATSINLGAADPTNSGNPHDYWFDGISSFQPGTALSIVYSVTTSTALFHISLWGIEVPFPLQG